MAMMDDPPSSLTHFGFLFFFFSPVDGDNQDAKNSSRLVPRCMRVSQPASGSLQRAKHHQETPPSSGYMSRSRRLVEQSGDGGGSPQNGPLLQQNENELNSGLAAAQSTEL